MNELHPALLPQGLRDLLPPDAAWEAEVVTRLAGVLTRNPDTGSVIMPEASGA